MTSKKNWLETPPTKKEIAAHIIEANAEVWLAAMLKAQAKPENKGLTGEAMALAIAKELDAMGVLAQAISAPTKEQIKKNPFISKEYKQNYFSAEEFASDPYLNPKASNEIGPEHARPVINAINERYMVGMVLSATELASVTKFPTEVIKQLLNEFLETRECSVIKIDDELFLVGAYPDTAQ